MMDLISEVAFHMLCSASLMSMAVAYQKDFLAPHNSSKERDAYKGKYNVFVQDWSQIQKKLYDL